MSNNILLIIITAILSGLFTFFLKEIVAYLSLLKDRSGPFFAKWVCDNEWDIELQLLGGLLTIIKYKDYTIVRWLKKYEPAGKWQGHESPK
jgi:hypothetical protein